MPASRVCPRILHPVGTRPPSKCMSLIDQDSGNVCSDSSDNPQIRRIVGNDYTILYESRNSNECIAFRKDVGGIRGCGEGELYLTDRIDEHPESCRSNVAIMEATLEIKERTFDIINAHPESRSIECRNESLLQIFTDVGDGVWPSEGRTCLHRWRFEYGSMAGR